ncbi:MAG TPA: ABC transporter, partial [Syntrophomonas wolfei]|nr:ABC transporter [Syntrophomonas wolfei]
MSTERKTQTSPMGAHGGGPRGGPLGPMGRPAEKAKDFKGSFKRLLGYLKPRRFRLLVVLLFAVLSTVFSIASPKIMGKATTKLFEGLMMKLKHVPEATVDFNYILNILFILAGLYIISAIFMYIQQYIMAGVAQQTVYDMRRDVNLELFLLPLKFFDYRTHGDIL